MKISRSIYCVSSNKNNAPTEDVYTNAEGHIRSAIDALGEIASQDSFAKDTIANLSVVLLDIKSRDKE